MSRGGREVEMLLLAMFAAVPLYLTQAIGIVPLIVFHVVLGAMTVRVLTGRGPDVLPASLMRVLAFVYIGFYIVDAVVISRSAIAASTHLVLFIAAYQPIESLQRNNLAQRLLTTGLIFIASLATSTHIAIVPFVFLFGFFMFRQLMYVSHTETIRAIGRPYALAPLSRSAGFYIVGAALIGAMLFPLLPRLRNPMVRGLTGALHNAATGLSESIDFSRSRVSDPDPAVVARVWMSHEAVPFFTPVRLRGAVYDAYSGEKWLQTSATRRAVRHSRGVYRVARPLGFTRAAQVQQVGARSDGRLYLPAGTYAVRGLPILARGATRESYFTSFRTATVTYEASMSRAVEPLEPQEPRVPRYPATPAVATMAREVVGTTTGAEQRARLIEQHLLNGYQYVQRPEDIGRGSMSVDEFLITVRRGHCEYFAAGMVAMLATLDVPSRIVGGFYGGRMNPLTGYLVVRREDAHAWVEVWNGSRWVTFDPTPPSLRPGAVQAGMFGSYLAALSESATYFWDRYVLTFGLGDQVALALAVMEQSRGALRAARRGLRSAASGTLNTAVVGVALVLAGLLTLIWIAPLARRSAFDGLVRYFRGRGVEVSEAMTVEEALVELRETDPEEAMRITPLVELYEAERFSGRPDPKRKKLLRQLLSELKA